MARDPVTGKWTKLYLKLQRLEKNLSGEVSVETLISDAKEAAALAKKHCDSDQRLYALGNTVSYAIRTDIQNALEYAAEGGMVEEREPRTAAAGKVRLLNKIVLRESGMVEKRRPAPKPRAKPRAQTLDTKAVLAFFKQLVKIQNKYSR